MVAVCTSGSGTSLKHVQCHHPPHLQWAECTPRLRSQGLGAGGTNGGTGLVVGFPALEAAPPQPEAAKPWGKQCDLSSGSVVRGITSYPISL